MSGHDHDGGRPRAWTRWRVAAVVLVMVLGAVACTTNRGATQPPTTSIRSTGVPATTSNGASASPPPARDRSYADF